VYIHRTCPTNARHVIAIVKAQVIHAKLCKKSKPKQGVLDDRPLLRSPRLVFNPVNIPKAEI
jgi:hypothetical protein